MNYFTIRSIITLIILGIALIILKKYQSKKKYIAIFLLFILLIPIWIIIFEHKIIKFNHYSDIGEYVLPYQKKIFYIRGDNYIFAFYNDHGKYKLKHFINENNKWIVLKSYFDQETSIKKYNDYTILINKIEEKNVAAVSIIYPINLLEQTKIEDNYNSDFKRRKFSLSEKNRNYAEYAIVEINEDYELLINEEKYSIFK